MGITEQADDNRSFAHDANHMERQTSRLSRLLSHTSHADLPTGDEVEDLVGPPPDGGRDAWMCVVGGLFQQFCIFGLSEFCVLLFCCFVVLTVQ